VDNRGPGKGKTLEPIHGDEDYFKTPKPPSSKPTVPSFRVPPRSGLHVPNTPKVPKTARQSLQDTLFPRPPKGDRQKSGSQTARLPAVKVGRFVDAEAPDQGFQNTQDTSFVSSSLPWEPRTSRPHAEHNASSTSWFGGKFQGASPSGWNTARLREDLKDRPVTMPSLMADGRPAVHTGFRVSTGNILTGQVC